MQRAKLVAGSKVLSAFIALWLVPKVISHDYALVIMYILSFGVSAVYLVGNRKIIIDNIKAWPSSFAFTVVVFYVSKVLAEKTINSTMGIEAEYIKQSSVIGGFIISVPLSLMVASCALFARSGYLKFVFPVVNMARTKAGRGPGSGVEGEIKKEEFFPGLRPMFACCVLFLATLLLSQAERGIRYAVLLDAMMYSDCGPAQTHRGYIRKNANACYQFDTRFFKGSSVPVEIVSKKP